MANVWTKFMALLPASKQLIGTIVELLPEKEMCRVQLLSGDFLNVYGTGDVDGLYLIVDGEISRKMEAKTVYNNEVVY